MAIYIPPNCITLDKVSQTQIRLGIQGFPGNGKTFGALTFPNPLVANFDKGLGAHIGRPEIAEAPFYDDDFCRTINPNYKNDGTTVKYYLKDITISWLEKEATKLTEEQTLVWDGGTGTQNAYHHWFKMNQMQYLTKNNVVDEFAEWKQKLIYFGQICETFKALKCHVVYITHESERADKPTSIGQPGEYTGKLRPLISGQFRDQIVSHFTDWFRQHAMDKLDDKGITPEILKKWGMTKDEYVAFQNSLPRDTRYFWQTESDDSFDGKCSSMVNYPRFVPANYSSFLRHSRRISPDKQVNA